MTISYKQVEAVGGRIYLPEGPFGAAGQFPIASFTPGYVVGGDAESEYTYLFLNVAAALTLNQGDVLVWDNSYVAVQSQTGAGIHPFGADVGTFFLGGRVGDPAAAPNAGNVWSYTFSTTGVYGIWVQRAGTSLMNIATVNAQSKPINTTAVLGQVNQPAAALAGSMGIGNAWSAPTSFTCTATTTTGSTVLTAVNTNKGMVIGQQLSGTGIATGAYIKDLQGATITMSLAATSSATNTITASNNATTGNVTNLSAAITGVATIPGIYPNQTITGTGIPASTTILSITGTAGNYTINLSAAATATNAAVALTTSIYVEAFLRWPNVSVQN
jgi:hypothetical protein